MRNYGANCNELPFGLQFDDSRTRVVNDFCNEVPTNIGGSIELETNLDWHLVVDPIIYIFLTDQMATQTVQ